MNSQFRDNTRKVSMEITTGSYKVLEDNTENMPHLMVHANAHLDMSFPGSAGFMVGAKYWDSALGEFTFLAKRYKGGFIEDELNPLYTKNYMDIEGCFSKYIVNRKKDITLRLPLRSISGANIRVSLYADFPTTKTILSGPRAGLIYRSGSGVTLNEEALVQRYNQVSVFAGYSRTKMVRFMEDFTDIGITGRSKTTTIYADAVFAPIQSQTSITMNYDSTKQGYPAVKLAKIPFGFRVGVSRFNSVFAGRWGFQRTTEIGWRPTYGSLENGIYVQMNFGIYIGYKHNQKKYKIQTKMTGDYYDMDWYEKEKKRAKDRRKSGEPKEEGTNLRLDINQKPPKNGSSRSSVKEETTEETTAEKKTEKEEKKKSAKVKKPKKQSKSAKKRAKKKAVKKRKKQVKASRNKTSKYKKRGPIGKLIYGKNSKKLIKKSRFG